MGTIDRRQFLKGAAAVGGAVLGSAAAAAPSQAATRRAAGSARRVPALRPATKLAKKQEATFVVSNLPSSGDPDAELAGSPRRWDIFEALCDPNPDNGSPQPFLATSWRAVSDTAWRFTLRPGVRFQDGSKLTPEDVVFSFERASQPGYATQSTIDSYKSARVVDGDVVISLSRPDPLAVRKLSRVPVISKAYYLGLGSDQKARDAAFATKPMGTGPYRRVSINPEQVVVEASRRTTWRKPILDKVTLVQNFDPAAQVSAFVSGSAQYVNLMPISSLPELRSAGGKTLVLTKGDNLGCFITTLDKNGNPLASPVANRLVRQALNYGLDKEALVKTVLGGYTTSDYGQLGSPGEVGFDPRIKGYPYDPAKANQLLDQAGYPKGSNGTRFSLTMASAFAGPGSDKLRAGEFMQNQISQLGIDVSYTGVTDVATSIGYFYGTITRPDILHFGLFNRPLMDPSAALTWFTSSNPSKWFANPDFDKAFAEQETELDQAKRSHLLYSLDEIFFTDCPYLFAYGEDWIDCHSAKLGGTILSNAETEQYFDRLYLTD